MYQKYSVFLGIGLSVHEDRRSESSTTNRAPALADRGMVLMFEGVGEKKRGV
jgi:hypothetical protein